MSKATKKVSVSIEFDMTVPSEVKRANLVKAIRREWMLRPGTATLGCGRIPDELFDVRYGRYTVTAFCGEDPR